MKRFAVDMLRWWAPLAVLCLCLAQSAPQPVLRDPFPAVVSHLRPSVVAIGTYFVRDIPTAGYFGTGFVVDDGRSVITNHHVIESIREDRRLDYLRVFLPDGDQVHGRPAQVLAVDPEHDLALLRFEGAPIRAMRLGAAVMPSQGQAVGVMGYPMGWVLGVVPAVHKGVVAAVVTAVRPLPAGAALKPHLIKALRRPYMMYQLDMVVFPGNSGSPVFDARSGQVVGVINKTLAAKTREHLMQTPSGVAYAVPAKWAARLIEQSQQLSQARERRTGE